MARPAAALFALHSILRSDAVLLSKAARSFALFLRLLFLLLLPPVFLFSPALTSHPLRRCTSFTLYFIAETRSAFFTGAERPLFV